MSNHGVVYKEMAMRKDVLISLLSVKGVMSAWKEEWVAIPQNIYIQPDFQSKKQKYFLKNWMPMYEGLLGLLS